MYQFIVRKLYLVLIVVSLSGCARGCQEVKRDTLDNLPKKYRVTLYSGGNEVRKWEFTGVINSSKSSDGYYFYADGKLVEVSGDVVIKVI